MTTALSPIISEFASEEQAARHDAWLRAKVRASLDDSRPPVAHDELMAEADAVIAEAEALRKRRPE